MAYQAHTRFQFGGVFGTFAQPLEIWSCTFNTSLASAMTDTQWTDASAAIATLFSDLHAFLSSKVRLTFIKGSLCDASNHVVGAVRLVEEDMDVGTGAPHMPPQCAVRISLQGDGRGRSKQGGFYLPLIASNVVDTTLELAQADADTIAGAAGTCLAVNIPAAGVGQVIVASGRIGNVPVVEARVGRAIDTIRRRRGDLVEQYSLYGF